jgi:hypothetical protein
MTMAVQIAEVIQMNQGLHQGIGMIVKGLAEKKGLPMQALGQEAMTNKIPGKIERIPIQTGNQEVHMVKAWTVQAMAKALLLIQKKRQLKKIQIPTAQKELVQNRKVLLLQGEKKNLAQLQKAAPLLRIRVLKRTLNKFIFSKSAGILPADFIQYIINPIK